ncbi:MAG TPA: hypothetical protein DCZ59_04865 [Bacteroidetes bacterium]|nr:hypothetical protein [Bacteroidota bacterium]
MDCRPLKGFGAFEETLRSGRRVTSGPLSLTAAPMSDAHAAPEQIQYGVGIPKRVARLSVARNRVKRLLRESVRRHVCRRADELSAHGFVRLVFLWRQAPTAPMLLRLRDVEPHVERALEKLMKNLDAPRHSS